MADTAEFYRIGAIFSYQAVIVVSMGSIMGWFLDSKLSKLDNGFPV